MRKELMKKAVELAKQMEGDWAAKINNNEAKSRR